MTAQEARQITLVARLKDISSSAGDSVYLGLMKRVQDAAVKGEDYTRATIMARHAKEIEARLTYNGFTCRHWNLDHSVSAVIIEW